LPDDLESHYSAVIDEIISGRGVVPFLGAGANRCNRPSGAAWKAGQFLPDGRELAEYLGKRFRYPDVDASDLVRVAEYVALARGEDDLYDELHELFDHDYPPTPLHIFLARLPGLLPGKGYQPRGQLIVSTNYDDVLERAFRAENEEYDQVIYMAAGEERGKFLHISAGGDPILIERPNEYQGLSVDEEGNLLRPVLLRLGGAVDRTGAERDSFVITEEHIDHLTRTDIGSLVPVELAKRLRKSHFLLLGCRSADADLRLILRWFFDHLNWKSWAIQFRPGLLDRRFWLRRNVDILDVELDNYVEQLVQRFEAYPVANQAAVP
jgi:hypothetical protein